MAVKMSRGVCAPQGIENADIRESSMATLKWGTDYLLKTFQKTTNPESSSTRVQHYNIVYQVGSACMAQHASAVEFNELHESRQVHSGIS